MRFMFLTSVIFILAVSCVSYQNAKYEQASGQNHEDNYKLEREREPVVTRSPAQNEPVTFDQVVGKSLDGLQTPEQNKLVDEGRQFLIDRRKFGQTGAFIKKCASDINHPFCGAYRFYKGTPKEKNREPRKLSASAGTVKKYFKTKDYENLKNIKFSNVLSVAKKMKFDDLKKTSKEVVEHPQCLSDDLYLALGSSLELDFPNDDTVSLNNQLLERAQKCFNTEQSTRSIYRLGMFKVWKNQCDDAIPLFDLSLSNQNMRNLHSRSMYWREWCKSKKSAEEKTNASVELYKNFPESFHALLAEEAPSSSVYNLLASKADPTVKFRSSNNKDFNNYLDTLDVFIKIGEPQIAFWLVENLKSDQFQNEDPEALLYLAVICNRVQAGLVKFQILGKVFDKNPALKTIKTMKLYYPSWYMDTVLRYKDKVNPYLIMALIRQESAFNTRAHSVAGARGLMQLLPGTARSFGRVKKHELFTPEKNIASGVKFFAHLMERYDGQVPLALAAYNAGPLNVDGWVKRYPTDNPLLFIDIIPFRETREYVSSILRNWYWYNKLYSEQTPAQSNGFDPNKGIYASEP